MYLTKMAFRLIFLRGREAGAGDTLRDSNHIAIQDDHKGASRASGYCWQHHNETQAEPIPARHSVSLKHVPVLDSHGDNDLLARPKALERAGGSDLVQIACSSKPCNEAVPRLGMGVW